MQVVGTAGHVDHGKSTLVKALTGIDPDRLQEEKDRQMTIDLGFAWMTLPSGEGLGFVDVPGHRDFIENMLAGVGGIDAALLVIAADEGIMPQTREHLAILDLLEVGNLIVALSRVDLVHESEWIDLVEEETRALLHSTRFSGAPMVRVSPVSGEGMEDLLNLLDSSLGADPSRSESNKPRLPIDRAFTIAGFGTIVTGTLLDGELNKGEEVELLPSGYSARIRGLQTHKKQVDIAEPGSRVAANLTGVGVDQIERGDVLSYPGSDTPTSRIDVQCRVISDAAFPIRHNATVKFFSGSAQRMARIRLLQKEPLSPGDLGWLQLELEHPTVVRRGDHFIVRQPSPGSTLGGGRIANPHPTGRHKRSDPEVFQGLEQLMSGEPELVLLASIGERLPVRVSEAAQEAGLSIEEAVEKLARLQDRGDVTLLNKQNDSEDWLVMRALAWEEYASKAQELVENYHDSNPLRAGIPVGELRSRLGSSSPELIDILVERGILQRTNGRIRLPGFEVIYSKDQQRRVEALMGQFAAKPFNPPTYKECEEAIGTELLEALIEEGLLIKVGETVLFEHSTYDEMRQMVSERLRAVDEITIAQVRDMFGTSRKYALALMEHLDSIGLTYRRGDARRLVRA